MNHLSEIRSDKERETTAGHCPHKYILYLSWVSESQQLNEVDSPLHLCHNEAFHYTGSVATRLNSQIIMLVTKSSWQPAAFSSLAV